MVKTPYKPLQFTWKVLSHTSRCCNAIFVCPRCSTEFMAEFQYASCTNALNAGLSQTWCCVDCAVREGLVW